MPGRKQKQDYREVLKWKKSVQPPKKKAARAPKAPPDAAARSAEVAECEAKFTEKCDDVRAHVDGLVECVEHLQEARDGVRGPRHTFYYTTPSDVTLSVELPRQASHTMAEVKLGDRDMFYGVHQARHRMALIDKALTAARHEATRLEQIVPTIERLRAETDEGFKTCLDRAKKLRTTANNTLQKLEKRDMRAGNTGINVFAWLPDELVVRLALLCVPREVVAHSGGGGVQVMILERVLNPEVRHVCRRFKRIYATTQKGRAKLWYKWPTFNIVPCTYPKGRTMKVHVNKHAITEIATLNGHLVRVTNGNEYRVYGRKRSGKQHRELIATNTFPDRRIVRIMAGTASVLIHFSVDARPPQCKCVFLNVVTGKETPFDTYASAFDPTDDTAIVAGWNGEVRKLTSANKEVWKHRDTDTPSSIADIVAGFGRVIIYVSPGVLWQLDSATGAVQHKITATDTVSHMAVCPWGAVLIFWDMNMLWHLCEGKLHQIGKIKITWDDIVTTTIGAVCLHTTTKNECFTLS